MIKKYDLYTVNAGNITEYIRAKNPVQALDIFCQNVMSSATATNFVIRKLGTLLEKSSKVSTQKNWSNHQAEVDKTADKPKERIGMGPFEYPESGTYNPRRPLNERVIRAKATDPIREGI